MMLETLNLKNDMPPVDVARRRLIEIIQDCKRRKVRAIKIIHGYGSSGVGGAIRLAVRKSLAKKMRTREIRFFVRGETWNVFDKESQSALLSCESLSGDADLNMGNAGVTIIVF